MSLAARIPYLGITPATDSNVYVLFSTTGTSTIPNAAPTVQNPTNGSDVGANFAAHTGLRKLVLTLKYSQAGILKLWSSVDRGVNWRQVNTETLGVPAATDEVFREYLVETMRDFKLDFTNQGTAQSPFIVEMALDPQRAIA